MKFHADSGATTKIKDSSNTLHDVGVFIKLSNSKHDNKNFAIKNLKAF